MAHTPYHMEPLKFQLPYRSLSPEERARRTKEQKEARQKEIEAEWEAQIKILNNTRKTSRGY